MTVDLSAYSAVPEQPQPSCLIIRYESVSTVKKRQRKGKQRVNKRSQTLTGADSKPPVERQTFVFSATLSLPKSEKQRRTQKKDSCSFGMNMKSSGSRCNVINAGILLLLTGDLMEKVGLRSHPCVIDLTQQHVTAETLTETRITCTEEEKVWIYFNNKWCSRSTKIQWKSLWNFTMTRTLQSIAMLL